MSQTILIVDDDPQIRELLGIALGQAGFATEAASDGLKAVDRALKLKPDLVVLDIGMPELDGLEVCRRIRAASDVPILFLTARDDEIDRVLGFELGGDDYVTKPFSPRELVARIKAILKRGKAHADAPVLRHGDLALDMGRHEASVSGRGVALTATELKMLTRLMERPDHVVTRPQLLDAIYGNNIHVSDRTVDSHLRNLRRKLADAGLPEALKTLHGVGIGLGPCRAA